MYEQADFCTNGYIYWGGPVEADGVGWYFAENRVGNWVVHQLKEEELPAAYKPGYTDSTAVKICLQKSTERSPCYCSAPAYYYHITFIQKR